MQTPAPTFLSRLLALKDARFLRFLAVGVLNTLVGYGLFALFIFIGLHYAMAALAGTILSVIFNFFSTGKLVFDKLERRYLIKFTAVYALLYGFNILLLKLLIGLSLDAYLAGFILLPVMAILSYWLQSRFTFN